MLFSLKELQNYHVITQDGTAVKIDDFIIDTEDWVLRYIIVDFDGRLFPISVQSLRIPALHGGDPQSIRIDFNDETIRNSPRFDVHSPLARDVERQLSEYYHWPNYWESHDIPQSLPGDLSSIPMIDLELERREEEQEMIPGTGEAATGPVHPEPHLGSFRLLDGYTIYATNSKRNAGRLVDLVTQDKQWNLLYLIDEIGGILSTKKVLLSPSWVQKIDPEASRIDINLTEETIRNSPSYTSIPEITEEYQNLVKDYFDQQH